MVNQTCSICGEPAGFLWRCRRHDRCDDCGTREHVIHDVGRGRVECSACKKKRVRREIESFRGDTDVTDEVTCPWCGTVQSDSWEYDDGEWDCGNCEKEFLLTLDRSVTYTTKQVTDG